MKIGLAGRHSRAHEVLDAIVQAARIGRSRNSICIHELLN